MKQPSIETGYGALRLRVTGELRERGSGTELSWRLALESLLPRPPRGLACRFFARRLMRVPARFEKMDRLVEAERADDSMGPTI